MSPLRGRMADGFPTLTEIEAEMAKRGMFDGTDPNLYGIAKAIPAEEDLPPAVFHADRLEPKFRRMFMRAVAAAKGRVSLEELARAVASRNVSLILERLYIDELEGDLKAGTVATLRQGFLAGARVGAEQLEAAGINVRFDVMDAHAVQWAERHAGKLITEVVNVQKVAVSELVAQALRVGRTVDEVARDLKTFIGLHSKQTAAVEKYRAKLEAEELADDIVDRRVGRYAEGLLNYRARMIARTEVVSSANRGQKGQWDLAAQEGLFDKAKASKVWLITPDDLIDKEICLPMDEPSRGVVGFNEPWTLPDGTKVDIPQESHPQCRCGMELTFE